jgi:hypothetical protein
MGLTPELTKILNDLGWDNLRIIEGRGICGTTTKNFLFTNAIAFGLDENGWRGRWCYPKELGIEHVKVAFKYWKGEGDPLGDWMKHKGITEYGNPATMTNMDKLIAKQNEDR